MAHIGVKNRTEDAQVLTHDGRTVYFKPGEVKLIEGVDAGFVETRVCVFHPKVKNPQTGIEENSKQVQGLRLFDVMTIDEALKAGARPDEDPRVLALRQAAEAKKKERAELLSELKASLVEDGWQPPVKAPKKEVATNEKR